MSESLIHYALGSKNYSCDKSQNPFFALSLSQLNLSSMMSGGGTMKGEVDVPNIKEGTRCGEPLSAKQENAFVKRARARANVMEAKDRESMSLGKRDKN
jgi:hypothetical protein